jgi:cysteinyl-tRNA synthetase
VAALEDDLNTPKAMAEFFGLARELNKATDPGEQQQLAATMYATGDMLGLLQQDPDEWFAGAADGELGAEAITEMIEKRNAARAAKDFATADALRDELAAAGVQIEDGPQGTTWRRA